jgi:flagellar protein FlaJ
MKIQRMHWFGIVAGVIIILFDILFFRDNSSMLFFIIGIGIGTAFLPFVVSLTLEGRTKQKLDERFLEFSRNLAESVMTGTPVSRSIINMRKNNYGVLNPYVQKLANQIEIGIPVEKALQTFANDVDSPVVKRAIALIREAEKAGGDIDYILSSTTKSISETEKLRQERRSAIYSLVIQGYTIFFIFIGIILVMEFKIIPLTAGIGSFGAFTGSVRDFDQPINTDTEESFDPEEFTRPFLVLLLTQGLFVGLVIGKLTEGTIKSGIKHSFILMITSFLISSGARLFIAIPAGA